MERERARGASARVVVGAIAGAMIAVCLVPAGGSLAGEPAPAAAQLEARVAMQSVLEALIHLFPLSLDERKWASPENRTEIARWLDKLAGSGHALEVHAEGRDVGFRYLSRSLSSDIEEIRNRFELGRYEESRFFMIESTGNCVACHSRLPSSTSYPLSDKLVEKIVFDALSAHEQVQILVATRQFDAALATWERAFADPMLSPGQLDMGGYFLDYLTIALRVQADPGRARRTLTEFSKRGDVPTYLQRHVASWIRALGEVGPELGKGDRLVRARALIKGEAGAGANPLGRERFIYDLVASSLLLQFIDGPDHSDAELAEAFYWLGLVEARSVDSYWIPQAEFHLEASIRLAPGSSFAEEAYAVLEEYVVLGYGGVSGGELPADVWAKLTELRELIAAERKPVKKGEKGKPG